MTNLEKQQLTNAGWQVGSTTDFLGLSEKEVELIEARLLVECKSKKKTKKRKTRRY